MGTDVRPRCRRRRSAAPPGFSTSWSTSCGPMLAGEYRMDLHDQGYAGHSGGGPVRSVRPAQQAGELRQVHHQQPPPPTSRGSTWKRPGMRRNADLKSQGVSQRRRSRGPPIRIWSASQIVSTVATMAERLAVRRYPSLELTVRIFPDEDHLTVMPVAYTRGNSGASGASRGRLTSCWSPAWRRESIGTSVHLESTVDRTSSSRPISPPTTAPRRSPSLPGRPAWSRPPPSGVIATTLFAITRRHPEVCRPRRSRSRR